THRAGVDPVESRPLTKTLVSMTRLTRHRLTGARRRVLRSSLWRRPPGQSRHAGRETRGYSRSGGARTLPSRGRGDIPILPPDDDWLALRLVQNCTETV